MSKTVSLYKLNSHKATVVDPYMENYYWANKTENLAISESNMYIYHLDIKDVYSPVYEVNVTGVTEYISIHPEDEKILALIINKNEIKSLEDKIKDLTEYVMTLNVSLSKIKTRISEVNFWTRLKWLFTGVRLC